MTKMRRLLIVAAGLAAVAVVSSSSNRGNAKDKKPLLEGDRPPLQGQATVEADMAVSRFADRATITYQPLKGDLGYFALQVKPKLDPVRGRPRDILVLMSMAATQAGPAWTAAQQIAERLVKDAGPKDRISLWTIGTPDVTGSFTGQFFVDASDKDGQKTLLTALAKYKKEKFPAGDTDLKNGLAKAITMFAGKEWHQRIIVYLGDGQSTHAPIQNPDRNDLCASLIKNKIAFYSVPLGVQLDPKNLHGLATGSGGTVLRSEIGEKVDATVKRYQEAFNQPIFYPTEFKVLTPEVTEYYPTNLPPLRTDTPTLVVGRVKAGAKVMAAQVKGLLADKKGDLQPTALPEIKEAFAQPELDNFFLLSLSDQWKNAKTLPAILRADRALALAFEQNRLDRRNALEQAYKAIDDNRLDVAVQFFNDAKQLAPDDVDAKAGLRLVGKLKDGTITRAKIKEQMGDRKLDALKGAKKWVKQVAMLDQDDPKVAKGVDPKVPNDPKIGKVPERDDFLKAHKDQAILEGQKLSQTVQGVLRQARDNIKADPDGVMEMLHNTLLDVRNHPTVDNAIRDALLSQLTTALQNSAQVGKVAKQVKEDAFRALAVLKNEDEKLRKIRSIEERTETQFRVFKNLTNLAKYEVKTRMDMMAGLLAMEAEARQKGQTIPLATRALYDTIMPSFALRQNDDLKALRADRWIQVTLEIEKAHVPYPDEPGIFFPPLVQWNALTKYRKDKYEVTSLPDDEVGRAEANAVAKLLQEQVETKDFLAPDPGIRFKDFLELLYEKFAARGKELPILVDIEAFKAEVAENDADKIYNEPIKFQPFPKKMSLAFALRFALSKLPNAEYLIRRNYIEVTTADRQLKERVLNVFAVADLVMPINNGGGMMGMGMGGGMPMMGGMGMGGMGMMGMGGGMMGGMPMMGGGMMGGMPMMGGGMMGGMPMMGGGMMGGMPMMGGGMMGGMPMMGGGMMGGMPMMGGGMMGGMPMMGGGMMGGMPMMGGGMMGGMPMMGGGMMGGMPMMGGGLNFQGGSFQGGFNGSLGMMGATQAVGLIDLITKVVAPGTWIPPQQVNPFAMQPFGMAPFGGPAGAVGNPLGAPAPPPNPALPMPADPNNANTIEFFPSALALIVRAPSRIHTSLTGGLIGGGAKRMEQAMLKDGLDREGKLLVANANDINKKAELDPRVVWQEALQKGKVDETLIIATADFLFECGHFEHAAEFLKANLRQGIVTRPWVFEALGVALEASKGSRDEIRRARLSAVALNPGEAAGFLSAAQTMAEDKQFERALSYSRQAAALEPNLVHTYSDALVYAEKSKDAKAMEWAMGKLLGQDWPSDNLGLQYKAQRKVQALSDLLKAENRGGEADRLRDALAKTKHRDLIIKLVWQNGTAPADLEMEIIEPSGTVCTSQQRQTPGGGNLVLPDLLSSKNDMETVYTASQAFTGDYKLTIRRNWGQPTGNRATLHVIQHEGTGERTIRIVPLTMDQTQTYTVSLEKGRRTGLAVVPPSAAQQRRVDAKEEKQNLTVSQKLRGLTSAEFTGAAGTTGSMLAAMANAPLRGAPTQAQMARQSTAITQPSGGMNYNAQTIWEGEQVRLRLQPVYQTATSGKAARTNLSMVPGGE